MNVVSCKGSLESMDIVLIKKLDAAKKIIEGTI